MPVRYFANSLAVEMGETDLKDAFDATIEAINTDGTAFRIVNKYGHTFKAAAQQYMDK